jgi:transposase InsO family protein
MGLRARTKRRFRVTTNSRHKYPVAANLLQREFTSDRPNRVWVSDITYVWTREGWLYLTVFIDLFSRCVVELVHQRFSGP